MTERALTGGRQWTKDIPNTTATRDPVSGNWTLTNGWQIDTSLTPTPYYETYWDMSAYTLDDLTFFPISAVLQDGQAYAVTDLADSAIGLIDIVSQERLDIAQVIQNHVFGNLPGQPLSTENFEQILMCNYRLMLPQVDFTSASLILPATTGTYGSLQPTACEKLWIYRIAIIGGTFNATVFSSPATRFVMAGTVVKEPELDYMMRLKRSYELSQ